MRVHDFKDLVIKYLESLLEVQNQVGVCFSFIYLFIYLNLSRFPLCLVDKDFSIVLGSTLLNLFDLLKESFK